MVDSEIENKARELNKLTNEIAEMELKLKNKSDALDMLQNEFVKLMEDRNIIEASVEGVGKIKLSQMLYASIKEEDRPVMFKKLKDMGEGWLIKMEEKVNQNTLKGWVGGLIREGKPIPEGIKYGFKKQIKIKA